MKEIGWRWHFYVWCFAPAALLWNYLRCRKLGPYKGNTLIVILSLCCYVSTFTTWTFLCRQRWSCRQGAQVTAAEGVDWSLMATPRPAVTVCGSGHQLSLGPWELSKNSDNKSNRVDYIFPFFFLFLRGCLLRNSLSFPLFFFFVCSLWWIIHSYNTDKKNKFNIMTWRFWHFIHVWGCRCIKDFIILSFLSFIFFTVNISFKRNLLLTSVLLCVSFLFLISVVLSNSPFT